MNSRWLSTFTLIGILLLVLGAVGLVLQHTGSGFVFDPGQPPPASGQDNTPLYYLVIGVLMVLNGLLTPSATPTEAPRKAASGRADAAPPAPRPSDSREAIATSSEQTGE